MKHIQSFENFLNEADSGAWKSFNTPANKNFVADIKQEISNWNWVANIAKDAEKSRQILVKVLFDLGYDDFDPSDMGFEIRSGSTEQGPFQYRGAIFCNVNGARKSSSDYNVIQNSPEFKKHFESIGAVTWVGQPTNSKYATIIVMNRTQLPR